MKKQFSIKAVKISSKNIIAAAKNESNKIFKLDEEQEYGCCPWYARMTGANTKPVFSL